MAQSIELIWLVGDGNTRNWKLGREHRFSIQRHTQQQHHLSKIFRFQLYVNRNSSYNIYKEILCREHTHYVSRNGFESWWRNNGNILASKVRTLSLGRISFPSQLCMANVSSCSPHHDHADGNGKLSRSLLSLYIFVVLKVQFFLLVAVRLFETLLFTLLFFFCHTCCTSEHPVKKVQRLGGLDLERTHIFVLQTQINM